MKDLVNSWIEELTIQRRYSNHTINSYKRDISDFKNFLLEHFGENFSLEIIKNLKISDFRSWFSQRISR